MGRNELNQILSEIRNLREQTIKDLADLSEDDFHLPTTDSRWTEIRRVLLRFGDHMKEHVNQIDGLRVQINRQPTMPERILARSEESWGALLAATLGLDDEDLDQKPGEEEWTLRQVLDHIRSTEDYYRELIIHARNTVQPEDQSNV